MTNLKNLLCASFCLRKTEETGLTDFFNTLEEMDKHIEFVPLSALDLYTPATTDDKIDFFDMADYSICLVKRGVPKSTVKKVSIDSLLDYGEEELNDYIEELLAARDSMIASKDGTFFVSEDALIRFAKLSQLTGDALRNQNRFRDNYIAYLLKDRCSKFSKKSTPKPAFTAVTFEQQNVKRVVSACSGNYKAIPQITLRTLYEDIMRRDDWGEVVCRDWYIDHDISYIDLEFPDLSETLSKEYMPDKVLPYIEVIPGIRLSTGSTGYNTLKVTMTWRHKCCETPALLDSVAQKHCNTYEGSEYVERIHTNIWDRYGELPQRLAELFLVPVAAKDVEPTVRRVINELRLNKLVFMQREDTPKTEKCNYVERLISAVVAELIELKDISAYDIATRLMYVADKIEMPVSYRQPLTNLLMKAPYCNAFKEKK